MAEDSTSNDMSNRQPMNPGGSGTVRKSHQGQAEQQEAASGTISQPIQPGETQPGEMNELAQNLGGPVDIFPAGGRRKTPQSGA